MITIDINCDMGEGLGNEELLMPYISSANIACGYHAGDESTMRKVMSIAKRYNVCVGAHPSFNDRVNFGRTMHQLPQSEMYDLINAQLVLFEKIAREEGVVMKHVKPHGALYNLSAKDITVASTIAQAVKDFNDELWLMGLSGSISVAAAKEIGLRTVPEVFADRTYQPDGSLTPRSLPGATIADTDAMLRQVLQIIFQKAVTSTTGSVVPIEAESICIHGDGAHAVEFSKHLFKTLQQNSIAVAAPSNQ
ncbi:MAG: 5-oxoprolinase subunit PxpA [Agriterribacter sp.]